MTCMKRCLASIYSLCSLAIAAAMASGFVWFALCSWTQWLYADLHRIIWNGAQSSADVLDWRYALVNHPDTPSIGSLAQHPTFDEALRAFDTPWRSPGRHVWTHLAQAAAIVAAATGPLFALLLLAARSAARRWLFVHNNWPRHPFSLFLAVFAGAVLAGAAWYASMPRIPFFPMWIHAHLTTFHAPLGALTAALLLILPLLLLGSASNDVHRHPAATAATSPSCPRCNYTTRGTARCPECGLFASDVIAFKRRRLRRFLAIYAAGLALALTVAVGLGRHAASAPDDPTWAARIGQWLRIRPTDHFVEGRVLPLRFDAVTQITLSTGDRWELLPFWFQATSPADVKRLGPDNLVTAVLARPLDRRDSSPNPEPRALAEYGPDLPAPVRFIRKGGWSRVLTRAPGNPSSYTGFFWLDADVATLRVRPVQPVNPSPNAELTPKLPATIEADFTAVLAARQWRWVPASSLP